VLASRRHTWSSTEALFPEVPSAADSKRLSTDGMPSWAQNYSIKIIEGLPLQLSQTNTEETADSVTIQWIQDEPRRSMDFLPLPQSVMRSFHVFTFVVKKWFRLAQFH